MFTFTIALENASKGREKFYFALLSTTLSHFWPHDRLLSTVVKRKRTYLSRNL